MEPTSRAMERVEGDGLYLVAFLKEGARVHRIAGDTTVTVGRGSKADVQVDHVGLSRAHFTLRAGVPATIRDLGSLNGTRVGGARLPPDTDMPIELGAVIDAGGAFFVLRDQDPHASVGSMRGRALEAAGPPSTHIVVEDAAMTRLHELVGLVAQSSMSVIVVGETGVGKEIVATALHERSPRAGKPLVRINCAAVPESLLESELFGFERGAFTGATQSKPGLIESADGSTFLLDEIGEMPLATQAKLLRVLESGEILRLGALKPRTVDVRFVAATNRPLPALVASRGFRADLYYRLNGITIEIPPLRERVAEIPKLAALFLAASARGARRPAPRLTAPAVSVLERHPWPGNVRELRNVMERALTICRGDAIGPESLLLDPAEPGALDVLQPARGYGPEADTAALTDPGPGGAREREAGAGPRGRLVRMDRETECAMILKALEDAGGNQGRAAELLGISRRTLINRLDEYGLERPRKK